MDAETLTVESGRGLDNGPEAADRSAALPWGALGRDAEQPPWEAMRVFARAMADDERGAVCRAVRKRFEEAFERELTEPDLSNAVSVEMHVTASFTLVSVQGSIALAGPHLSPDRRRQMAAWAMTQLNECAAWNYDFMCEDWLSVGRTLVPEIVPAAAEVLRLNRDTGGVWFYGWGMVEKVQHTDDPVARQVAIDLAMETLEAALDGTLDFGAAEPAATVLGRIGHTEAVPLINRILARVAEEGPARRIDRAFVPDYRESRHRLTEAAALDAENDDKPRVGDEPVETWLPQAWRTARQMAADVRRKAALNQSVALCDPEPVPAPGGKPKVGRNAPCPCGSGKKFKKCCG